MSIFWINAFATIELRMFTIYRFGKEGWAVFNFKNTKLCAPCFAVVWLCLGVMFAMAMTDGSQDKGTQAEDKDLQKYEKYTQIASQAYKKYFNMFHDFINKDSTEEDEINARRIYLNPEKIELSDEEKATIEANIWQQEQMMLSMKQAKYDNAVKMTKNDGGSFVIARDILQGIPMPRPQKLFDTILKHIAAKTVTFTFIPQELVGTDVQKPAFTIESSCEIESTTEKTIFQNKIFVVPVCNDANELVEYKIILTFEGDVQVKAHELAYFTYVIQFDPANDYNIKDIAFESNVAAYNYFVQTHDVQMPWGLCSHKRVENKNKQPSSIDNNRKYFVRSETFDVIAQKKVPCYVEDIFRYFAGWVKNRWSLFVQKLHSVRTKK